MPVARSIAQTLTFAALALAGAPEALAQSKEVIEVTRTDGGRHLVLKPEVYWPPGRGPFGAVVIVNSSAGADDIFLTVSPPRWLKEGIAAVVLDTYTPRGIRNTVRDQSQVTSTQMALDALAVAENLRRNPRIRADRIAMQGQSKGAVASLNQATAAWRQWARAEPKAFDAAMAFAPGCELQFRDAALASPLLAVLGEKDDWTLPAPCIRLFERMRAARQSVTWEVIPKANHGWSTTGTHHDPAIWSARKCADEPLYYTANGFESSKDGRLVPFADIHRHCGALGASVGGPHDQRGRVLDIAVKWLKGRGW